MWAYYLLLLGWVGGQVTSYAVNGIRIALLDIVLVIVLIWWFACNPLQNHLRNYFYRFSPFLAVGIISLVFQLGKLTAGEISYSSLYLVRFALFASITFIFARLPVVKRLKNLWVAGIGIGALGLLQYFLYPNLRNLVYLGWDPHEFRLFSTILDPNFAGIIFVLTIILGVYLWQQKWVSRRVFFGGNGLVLIALLLTYSRGSFLALLAAAAVWFWKRQKLHWFVIGMVLFGLGLLLLPRPGGEGVNLWRTISIDARLQNNAQAWNMFLRSPLIGNGFDTLRFVRPQTEVINEVGELAHSAGGYQNSWLFLLATTGILGFAAYLWIWYAFAKVLFGLHPKNSQPHQLILKKELWLMIAAAFIVHGQFDNSLFFPEVMIWLWVVVGTFF